MSLIIFPIAIVVSTHSHPKVAALMPFFNTNKASVSTHSHPKVAAPVPLADVALRRRFNTQPPEGGCDYPQAFAWPSWLFQHTATRRWLLGVLLSPSRRFQCFNTQPPEGGCLPSLVTTSSDNVSTHSHPKVAARGVLTNTVVDIVSTHSHPKVAALPVF